MRQYRGLTKDGKWVYGWYLYRHESDWDGHDKYIHQIHTKEWNEFIEVIPETVGQEVAIDTSKLRDFDTRFWEGDIIECQHGHRGVIVYDTHYKGGGQYWFGSGFDCDLCMNKERWYYYKVIGNKTEHPELLK